MDALTVAMFSGVLTLLGRPARFLGSEDPGALTLVIHFLMILAPGTLSCRVKPNRLRKALLSRH